MTHVFQFSGGKDSTALLLWGIEQGYTFTGEAGKPVAIAVMCDTGWEHPLTYEYIDYIDREVLGGKLVRIKSEKYPGGMVELVRIKRFIASATTRYCTADLKVKPFIAYMRGIDDEATVYQGIRGDESHARSQMPRRVWESAYEAWIERPLFDWSPARVFGLIQKHGVAFNPLYRKGCNRVGCFPCVMIGKSELARVGQVIPEIWERAQQLETAAGEGHGFFRCDFIPDRFHSGRYTKDGHTNTYPTTQDVRKYIEDATKDQLRLWGTCTESGCLSVYNLCE